MSNRTNKPSPGALSFILRHKELWPDGFDWSYASCATCAIGLAQAVWPQHIKQTLALEVGHVLGISANQANDIFGQLANKHRTTLDKVTPEMVADALEAVE